MLYLGSSLKVCFVEAILRDRRDGIPDDLPIDESELHARHYAEVDVHQPLCLVDLRGDAPLRMGVPSDVVAGSGHTLARAWSLAFHEHPQKPDGIIYPSRLNEETNIPIYGRAVGKLQSASSSPLFGAPDLAAVLETLKFALI